LECHAVRARKYRADNPCSDTRYRSYKERGPEKVRDNSRSWRERNREKVAAEQKRRVAKLKATDPKRQWVISVFCGARGRAKRKGVPFSITREYLRSICSDTCPVFGWALNYASTRLGPDSATIDRIDPKVGYVAGNIAVISHKANTIKQDATPDQIFAVAAWAKSARALHSITYHSERGETTRHRVNI
jgi:hypothetical protein